MNTIKQTSLTIIRNRKIFLPQDKEDLVSSLSKFELSFLQLSNLINSLMANYQARHADFSGKGK